MRQPTTAILLILAFIATLFAPVRAGWACPDGTPCVAGRGQGFVCVGDQCATRTSCCEVKRPLRCRHGAVPETHEPRPSGQAVEGPDHCRFNASAPPQVVAAAQESGKLLALSFDALPAPLSLELTAPVASPIWRSEFALGYRPPPIRSSGPSRAPPVA